MGTLRTCFPPAMPRSPRPRLLSNSRTSGSRARISYANDVAMACSTKYQRTTKKSAPEEDYFLAHIAHIEKTWPKQSTDTLMSMAGALMGVGKRSKELNAASLKVARKIGTIDFDPDGSCDPFDVSKHLTSDYVKKKLGL